MNILSKSARFSEVALKLLSTLTESNTSESDLKHLLTIHVAHIRYLQDEYAHLVVQGKYPKETAQMFRSLQRHTSGLNSEALKNLKLAVEVTGSSQQAQQGQFNNSFRSQRGRGRGSFFQRGRGRGAPSSDMYGRFVQNRVPQQNSAYAILPSGDDK